jgi:hypothetical protein
MKVIVYAAICLGCAPFAFGQIDAYRLQAKYVNRETFLLDLQRSSK